MGEPMTIDLEKIPQKTILILAGVIALVTFAIFLIARDPTVKKIEVGFIKIEKVIEVPSLPED
jgi:hypothetical protein